ncbi:hypothetical protein IE53DRAFT_373235 [Violaceomyces palustris]|uniref:Uncharacterized protein n=1 Tax=Violaceomyces palustris TaxID=1673888 RepID=A0ACD0P4X4_9BASI|nr:hypothetical protein IE53DRAFT_373235 [Violaceomyces palustris]
MSGTPPTIAFTAPAPIQTGSSPSSSSTTSTLNQQWIKTTHFFPAAWPRSNNRSARSDSYHPPPNQSDAQPSHPDQDPLDAKAIEATRRELAFEEWKARCAKPKGASKTLFEDLRDMSRPEFHQPRIQQARQHNEAQLWGCVERIVPVYEAPLHGEPSSAGNPSYDQPGITLVIGHANGFHKEVWEPTLQSLVRSIAQSPEYSSKIRIDEIWNFDCTHAGEAGSINRENLGEVISWFDHPRDILQLLDHYLPSLPPPKSNQGMPTIKGPQWLPPTLKRTGQGQGRKHRRLVAVGHSFSGAALAMLTSSFPDLFEGTILVDPAFSPPERELFYAREGELPFESKGQPDASKLEDYKLSKGAVVRKDNFANLLAARKSFLSKPFFQAWDPRVLELHLRFALRPLLLPASEGSVVEQIASKDVPLTLSNSKWHEASAFSNTWMSKFGWYGLGQRRHKGWTGMISMEGGFYSQAVQDLITSIPGGLFYTMPGGHLVAMEQPDALGEKLAELIHTQTTKSEKGGRQGPQIPAPRL